MRLVVLAAAFAAATAAHAAPPTQIARASPAGAAAARCRDAKGKFTACPAPPAAKAVCKDARGKFARCGTPGARPA